MLQTTGSEGSDRKLASGPVFDQGFSPREARRRAFIACSTGWAGFTLKPNPEQDEDEAAQARTRANVARREAADGFRDVSVLDSGSSRPVVGFVDLEEAYGIEAVDLAVSLLPLSDEDDEADEDSDGGYPDEDEHPRAAITVFRDGQFLTVTDQPDGGRVSAIARAWVRRREDVMETAARNFVPVFAQRAERLAKSVEGTVTRHSEYGIFVGSGRDVGLVHVDTVRGMGSRTRALAFLHGNAVGSKVRVIPGAYREAKRRYDLTLL